MRRSVSHAAAGSSYVFSAFDECLPLPEWDERGEGRGGVGETPNPTLQRSLLSPALSSRSGGEGEKDSAALNTNRSSTTAAVLIARSFTGKESHYWPLTR